MQNNPFLEMIPLIAFFITYYITKDLFLATGVCIATSWGYLIACKLKSGKIPKMVWLNTLVITVLGGITITLHNKMFVMLKPTALFWIVGTSILIGHIFNKNSIKLMLSKELNLPSSLWNKLNLAFGIFFIFMGGLNLFVAFNFSEYVWVKFKVFGTLGLTLLFITICGIVIYCYQKRHNLPIGRK
jgi:intracellular septation protein